MPRAARGVLGLAIMLVASVGLVAVGALLLLVSDPTWRTALREIADPAPAAAAADGPVLVLGGSPSRLPLALELPGVPGPTRPLWVSAPGRETLTTLAENGLSCDDVHVTCVTPDPASTYGEALALRALTADLTAALGADVRVTVVTSTFHVARTRWQLHACAAPTGATAGTGAGPDVIVMSPGAGPAPEDRPRLEVLKLVNAGLRTSCRFEFR